MTLTGLRLRGALRSLTARPSWLVVALTLITAMMFGTFRLVNAAVNWILDYPLIDTIAPAVIQRSLEGLFLMLMAAVLFSVLIASVGILYGSQDLELLLAQPLSSARIFTLKVGELFVNAAGLPVLFTIPVLAGIGAAMDAPPLYYLVSLTAALALYALPVTAGALLALLLVRFSPAGRVREASTAVSITFAAAAVLALRALRPEQLLNLNPADSEAFEAFLVGFTSLELGWLPPAWASNASWAALTSQLHPGLSALLVIGVLGLLLTGVLARLAYARGWVRSLDTDPAPRFRRSRPQSRLERAFIKRTGTVGAILVKDLRAFFRDVQQWSQLFVLVALAAVYFISLAALPVPTQQFRDVLGALNVAFMAFISAGVGIRIAYPAVSLEGAGYWLLQVQPVRARDVVVAKFLFVLPVMLSLGAALGIAAIRMLVMDPVLATASVVAAIAAAIAMSGLAVGIGAAQPQFRHTNANELAMTPGALTYMAFAVSFAALVTVLLARPAWTVLSRQSAGGYWTSPEGLFILLVLLLLTAVTTVVPLVRGTRVLARFEEN